MAKKRIGPFVIEAGIDKSLVKNLLKGKKEKEKPIYVKPTLGRVIKDEIKNSIRGGLERNLGILGSYIAHKHIGPSTKFDVNANKATPLHALRATTLEGAIKEHSKITTSLMQNIARNDTMGSDNLSSSIQATSDRVSASLSKLNEALEWMSAAPQPIAKEEAIPLEDNDPYKKKTKGGSLLDLLPSLPGWLKKLPPWLVGFIRSPYVWPLFAGYVLAENNELGVAPRATAEGIKKRKAEQRRKEGAFNGLPFGEQLNNWWQGRKKDDNSKRKENYVLGPDHESFPEIKELKYTFSKEIKFKAQKIIFKHPHGSDSVPSSSVSVQSGLARQRYEDNVKKYGKEKADQLEAMENRPTSVGGLLSRLSPSNWFGGAEQKAKNAAGGGGSGSGSGSGSGDGTTGGTAVPSADKSKTGDYKAGTERLLHASGNMQGLDPKLLSVMKAASKDLPEGYHAEIISARDPRSTGTTNHPNGIASDIKIYDKDGKLLTYDKGSPDMKYYEQFHQSMVERGKVMTPGETYIWGGTWIGQASGHGDPMHMQRKDASVPGSSQSSGAYNDDKGAKGHPFEPYLMNDKERAEYKTRVRENIQKESVQQSEPKTTPPVETKEKASPLPSDEDMKKADDKWFKGDKQGFMDQSTLNDIMEDVAKNGLRQGNLSTSDWNLMSSTEKQTWQANMRLMQQPEYQMDKNAPAWGKLGYDTNPSPNVDDRREGSFDPVTGEIKGFRDSQIDNLRHPLKRTKNDMISGDPLGLGLGDLPKGTTHTPSWGDNDNVPIDIPIADDVTKPVGWRYQDFDGYHTGERSNKPTDTYFQKPPATPFWDNMKPTPTSGPLDLDALTPKAMAPQIDMPEKNFRKYEGNDSDPDKGRRRVEKTEPDDDRAVGRRSFSEYTGNSYDEAG